MSTTTMVDTGLGRGLTTGDTRSHALVHARIMLRRNLRHMQRYPSLTLMITLMPLVFLLLFVYVFGGALKGRFGSDGLISSLCCWFVDSPLHPSRTSGTASGYRTKGITTVANPTGIQGQQRRA